MAEIAGDCFTTKIDICDEIMFQFKRIMEERYEVLKKEMIEKMDQKRDELIWAIVTKLTREMSIESNKLIFRFDLQKKGR